MLIAGISMRKYPSLSITAPTRDAFRTWGYYNGKKRHEVFSLRLSVKTRGPILGSECDVGVRPEVSPRVDDA